MSRGLRRLPNRVERLAQAALHISATELWQVGERPIHPTKAQEGSKTMPIEHLIYDVGMNNGDDTAYYLSLGFRIVAIEANPELVEQAKSRFAREIASGRLIILNIGIADREGELPFWICETNHRWSSFDRTYASWGNSPNHQIQVPCTRFETIVAQYGVPYFCKIDIQGNDFLCLEGFTPHQVPKFLSIEANDLNLRLLDMLRALGYSLFKCISQSTFIPLQVPPASEQHRLERAETLLGSPKFRHRVFRKLGGRRLLQRQLQSTRRYHDWLFPPQSSGGFGDQTLGRWLTYEEMKQTSNEFLRRREAAEKSIFWSSNKSYGIWTDYHAQYVEPRNPSTLQPDLSDLVSAIETSENRPQRARAPERSR
jgi:FkbM family methyltransferase